MRTFLFIVLLVLAVLTGYSVFSLEFSKLSEYGVGYLVGKSILFVVVLACLFLTGRRLLKEDTN